ncbi:TonB-dependent receptor [Pseudomonas sp. TH05]|uniref:TonB-dependent receptor n=1 Tax=unclassified Pseudomonas TaxID=196821 RepID=UPI001912295A|nr:MULTISPECIES: TonB-dependent receptor [unclassified Pseudomonas]MBK5540439.1 TonB-dependent receptor [Pseudomonas sp. TH07]MBK5555856.1 TonB-dependent receptor [Pseudomonas sp. TH05]
MSKHVLKAGGYTLWVGCWLGGVASVAAQTELAPVRVTANKIEQTQEQVPASLSVLNAEDLRKGGIDDLERLARVTPGFTFQPFGQSGTNLPVVRGLTSSPTAFSSSMLMLVDGVPTLMGQGFDHNLLGVEQVEILRGPQSTLYGRNAEAGVLSIRTRQPGAEPYARIEAGIGSRDQRTLSADASTALVPDTLYAGVSGQWLEQDGFIDDGYRGGQADDRERHSARMVLRWTPSLNTDVNLRYSRQDYRDGASLWGAVNASRREVRSGTPSWNHSSGRSLSLDVLHEFDSGLKLRSITARNDFYDRVQQDTDFMPADLFHLRRDYHMNTLSQEFRLEGQWRDSQWLLGAYADRDDHDLSYQQKLPLRLTRTDVQLGGNTTALFGQWVMPLAERWTLTLGARAEQDKVHIDPAIGSRQSDQWQRLTPKAALQYEWQPDAYLYGSYSEGFRAGGFNAFSSAANYPGYDPEKVKTYEVGAKGWMDDKRLRYSAALYWMDVRDMQVQQMIQPGVVYITNAASARSTGLDLEAEYLLADNWRLVSAVGLNRTRFQSFREGSNDYQGNRNPYAPDLTGHLSLRYDAPQGWWAQGGVSAVGKTYLDSANQYSRGGYGLIDLNAGYDFSHYGISAYVKNAADKRYDAVGYLNGTARVYSPPREIGLRVSYEL